MQWLILLRVTQSVSFSLSRSLLVQALSVMVEGRALSEGVVHLSDLLLRRVRLGLVCPEGGKQLLPKIRIMIQPELGWSDERWEMEEQSYLEHWDSTYRPPQTP